MNRLETAFEIKPVLMPYYPVGYPDLATSIDVIEALAKNGADIIEVGLSFSDPLADGPVIQKATQVALEKGITIAKALDALAELRGRGVQIPLILMGYYNPLLAYGLERFASKAAEVGADGFIIPDLPPEESGEFEAVIGALPLIRMVAPTTPPERMSGIMQSAKGFIYLVSVAGITGTRASLPEGIAELIQRVRKLSAIPVCVGFGISTPEQARLIGSLADGVIIGSACVRTIGESSRPVEAAIRFAQDFKGAIRVKIDAARKIG
jgi:tryptophan synthase alpha chain